MVHPLDHMASDPLRQGRKDHTAEKQPDSMQFPADNKHRGSRNTVKHAERPIHETSVYKPSLPHCRCHRLEDPAEKAERKEQPQSLKSCIPHILYLSSPDFSFVFPEALPHFCVCSPEYGPPLFHSLIFHPASIKSRTCIQIFYHISSSYRICFFYFVFSFIFPHRCPNPSSLSFFSLSPPFSLENLFDPTFSCIFMVFYQIFLIDFQFFSHNKLFIFP